MTTSNIESELTLGLHDWLIALQILTMHELFLSKFRYI